MADHTDDGVPASGRGAVAASVGAATTGSDAPSPDAPAPGAVRTPTARASQGGAGPERRRGPIDPRLLRRASATRWFLVALVAAGAAAALLTLAQAWLLADAITGVFYRRDLNPLLAALPLLAAVFAGKAALAWLNNLLAHRAAASVKSQLRRDIVAARLRRPIDPTDSTGSLVTLLTQGLDALDGFYAKYLPQLVLAVVVPLIVGVAILTTDVASAVIAAVTLPLIPLFMALVGWTTEARTQRRWALQTRLARHFADLVEGLPTLQAFGRARAQAIGLRKTEDAHRRETMATLRISFLSALVLELLATLSVAVVAVTVGFRVAFGQLDLFAALFVLILAPEVYLPVRQVGAHYHDSADGMAAAADAFARIDGPDAEPPAAARPAAGPATATATADSGPRGEAAHHEPLVEVAGLGHTYPGADHRAVHGVSFAVEPGAFVVLTGPSGGGKSTVLNALLGFVRPTEGAVRGGGVRLDDATLPAWRRRVAYVGQNPGMLAGTVADNVRLGGADAPDAEVRAALARAGASELVLDHPVGDDGQGLSAGERRRVATARALLRIDRGADLLLLDEPTAGLDADAEACLLRSLRGTGVAAVVVSHRPSVIAEADRVVRIGAGA